MQQQAEQLVSLIAGYGPVAVAFSGGVDSVVVAKGAVLAHGDLAVAVTAVSPSLAAGELQAAQASAAEIGIRHVVVSTEEFSDPNYQRNAGDRCYFCKSHLYARLETLLPRWQVQVICNGANLDDTGDHRPGMVAARERGIRSPLIELRFGKSTVRELARWWGLSAAEKPAMPCLASRIAYGVEVTPERLQRIDAAEAYLKSLLAVDTLRVRVEQGELARIEVTTDALPRLVEPALRSQVVQRLEGLGFRRVTLDLDGFRSGKMNDALNTQSLNFVTLEKLDLR